MLHYSLQISERLKGLFGLYYAYMSGHCYISFVLRTAFAQQNLELRQCLVEIYYICTPRCIVRVT